MGTAARVIRKGETKISGPRKKIEALVADPAEQKPAPQSRRERAVEERQRAFDGEHHRNADERRGDAADDADALVRRGRWRDSMAPSLQEMGAGGGDTYFFAEKYVSPSMPAAVGVLRYAVSTSSTATQDEREWRRKGAAKPRRDVEAVRLATGQPPARPASPPPAQRRLAFAPRPLRRCGFSDGPGSTRSCWSCSGLQPGCRRRRAPGGSGRG